MVWTIYKHRTVTGIAIEHLFKAIKITIDLTRVLS